MPSKHRKSRYVFPPTATLIEELTVHHAEFVRIVSTLTSGAYESTITSRNGSKTTRTKLSRLGQCWLIAFQAHRKQPSPRSPTAKMISIWLLGISTCTPPRRRLVTSTTRQWRPRRPLLKDCRSEGESCPLKDPHDRTRPGR